MRQSNEAGRAVVREFEGLRLAAYKCPAGVWTIGYGHTSGVQKGDVCDEPQADAWLVEDLGDAERAVSNLVSVPLTDNQFAALVSFTFNLGAGALRGSTLRELLNTGDYYSVPAQLARWTKATDPTSGLKITFPGLVRRRGAESALWKTNGNHGQKKETSHVASGS